MNRRLIVAVALPAIIILSALTLLLPLSSRAEELSKDDSAAFDAARVDAYQNLAARVNALSLGGRLTVGDQLNNPTVRQDVEIALRSAVVVEGPVFTPEGIARVVVQLDTKLIPYALSVRIRNLPAVIRVDGVANRAAAIREAAILPGKVNNQVDAWLDKKIEATGDARVDVTSAPDAAKANARRIALNNAYAALTKKIDALLLEPGLTLRAYLATHPQFEPAITANLILAQISSESIDPDGTKYSVTITLDPLLIARPLRLGKVSEWKAITIPANDVDLARSNAREEAEALLKQRVFDTPLRVQGMTVGKALEKKPPLKIAVERALRTLASDRVEYTNTGLCKIYMTFDMRILPDEIRQMFPPQTPDRIDVIGAGLPEKKAAPPAQSTTPAETTAPAATETAPAAAEPQP